MHKIAVSIVGTVIMVLLPFFLAYFPEKESEAYEITSLSVCLSACVSPPIIFEPIGRFL
jgi:hypothetical protein